MLGLGTLPTVVLLLIVNERVGIIVSHVHLLVHGGDALGAGVQLVLTVVGCGVLVIAEARLLLVEGLLSGRLLTMRLVIWPRAVNVVFLHALHQVLHGPIVNVCSILCVQYECVRRGEEIKQKIIRERLDEVADWKERRWRVEQWSRVPRRPPLFHFLPVVLSQQIYTPITNIKCTIVVSIRLEQINRTLSKHIMTPFHCLSISQ